MTKEFKDTIMSISIKEKICMNNLNDEEKKIYDSIVELYEKAENAGDMQKVNMFKIMSAVADYIVNNKIMEL